MALPDAVGSALSDVLGRLFGFVPGFLSVLAILIIGWIIARTLKKAVVTLLTKVGLDGTLEKTGISKVLRDAGSKMSPSELVGIIIYWIIMVAVFIGITNYLQLGTVSQALNRLLLFVPNILAALIIMVLAFILANSLAAIIKGAASRAEISKSDLLGDVAKWVLIALAGVIALDQLRIETSILKLALTYFVGASAIAVALAFGLGSMAIAKDVVAMYFVRERFKVGERITVEDYSGEIRKISATNTVIDVPGKGLVSVPNSLLQEKIVIS